MKLIAAFPYKSPREGTLTHEEKRIRDAAYGLKVPEAWAIEIAAHAMASAIIKAQSLKESSAIALYPVPDSKGNTSANRTLCEAISKALKLWLPGHHARTTDILRKEGATTPQHTLPEGKRQKAGKLRFVLEGKPDWLGTQFIVDNVTCSGQTLRAAQTLIPVATGLVFADARNTHRLLQQKRKISSNFTAAEIRTISTLKSPVPILGQSPYEIEDYHRAFIQSSTQYHPERENVVVVLLDYKLRILGHEFITQGTKSSACFKNAEVLRPVVASGASAFVVTHNHPSGDIRPSIEDLDCTKSMREAARSLGADFQDHIIIGEPRSFYSFRDAGHC